MSAKMTRYVHTEFPEDDVSSTGAIQLNEATGSTGLQIRYHTARFNISLVILLVTK
ncbi:neprilysin-3-like [Teleopsis dalmanni]|uniref:neprilysin-3-like n=1 Tax=Teleopsis dalmanni TaxID=139649 RepID=UPI0018CD458B|nr:neprilysin-3-like [Teleopsis dalmanni]